MTNYLVVENRIYDYDLLNAMRTKKSIHQIISFIYAIFSCSPQNILFYLKVKSGHHSAFTFNQFDMRRNK